MPVEVCNVGMPNREDRPIVRPTDEARRPGRGCEVEPPRGPVAADEHVDYRRLWGHAAKACRHELRKSSRIEAAADANRSGMRFSRDEPPPRAAARTRAPPEALERRRDRPVMDRHTLARRNDEVCCEEATVSPGPHALDVFVSRATSRRVALAVGLSLAGFALVGAMVTKPVVRSDARLTRALT
jgi:hypothetical protein